MFLNLLQPKTILILNDPIVVSVRCVVCDVIAYRFLEEKIVWENYFAIIRNNFVDKNLLLTNINLKNLVLIFYEIIYNTKLCVWAFI